MMDKIRYLKTYRTTLQEIADGSGDVRLEFPAIPLGDCAYLEYISLDTTGATAPVLRGTFGGPPEITMIEVGPENLAPGLRAAPGERFRADVVADPGATVTVATQWRLYELVKHKPARVSADKQPDEGPLSPDTAEDERRPDAEPQPESGLPRPDSDAGIQEDASPFPRRR